MKSCVYSTSLIQRVDETFCALKLIFKNRLSKNIQGVLISSKRSLPIPGGEHKFLTDPRTFHATNANENERKSQEHNGLEFTTSSRHIESDYYSTTRTTTDYYYYDIKEFAKEEDTKQELLRFCC